MSISPADLVGYIATIAGTSVMIPQVLKMLRTRSVGDVSLLTAILYVANCVLWLAYGFMSEVVPVIVANAIGLIVAVLQLTLKIRFSS